LLPQQSVAPGGLLIEVKRRLADGGESSGRREPSALSFWSEVAGHLPEVDGLGLTLESLDLLPDGGRMTARVPTGNEHPLGSATRLEQALNESPHLKARGDFEVQEGQVLVRLRLEYKP
jgi:hypothetical protein